MLGHWPSKQISQAAQQQIMFWHVLVSQQQQQPKHARTANAAKATIMISWSLKSLVKSLIFRCSCCWCSFSNSGVDFDFVCWYRRAENKYGKENIGDVDENCLDLFVSTSLVFVFSSSNSIDILLLRRKVVLWGCCCCCCEASTKERPRQKRDKIATKTIFFIVLVMLNVVCVLGDFSVWETLLAKRTWTT